MSRVPAMRSYPSVRFEPVRLDEHDTPLFLDLACGGGYFGEAARELRRHEYVDVLFTPVWKISIPYRAFLECLLSATVEVLTPSGRRDTVVAYGDLRCGVLDLGDDGTSILDACSYREMAWVLSRRIDLGPRPALDGEATSVGLPTVPEPSDVEGLAASLAARWPDLADDVRAGRWTLWSIETLWEEKHKGQEDQITVLDTPSGLVRTDCLPAGQGHLDWRACTSADVWHHLTTTGPTASELQVLSSVRRLYDQASPFTSTRLGIRRNGPLPDPAEIVQEPSTPEVQAMVEEPTPTTAAAPPDPVPAEETEEGPAPDVGPTWLDDVVDRDEDPKRYRLY